MFLNYLKFKLPLSIFVLLFFVQLNAQDDVFTEADQMPYFMGCGNMDSEEKRNCSNNNLIRFISNELVYPAAATQKEIEGTVYVSFIINEEGKVINPGILHDIGGGCGQAALDVLAKMPVWEAGIKNGQAVKVKLNLPIQFSLKNTEINEQATAYQINWGSIATQKKVSKKDLETQIKRPLYVRDAFGNEKPIVELIFAFEKRKNYLEGSSAGKINNDLKKVISKVKKGGTFSVIAVIQIKGELIYVRRSFNVV